jgi:hypothetical protein
MSLPHLAHVLMSVSINHGKLLCQCKSCGELDIPLLCASNTFFGEVTDQQRDLMHVFASLLITQVDTLC